MSLRTALLLAESDKPLDIDEIAVTDFVATYSGAFSNARRSINGDNRFMYNEYAVRRELADAATKRMVLEGFVLPQLSQQGYTYSLTDRGMEYACSLNSPYASEYRDAASFALEYVGQAGTDKIIRRINRRKQD